MNYRAHVAEMGREPPEYQYWFNKQRTSIAGPGDPIVLPTVSTMVDYEGELAMVIGRRCQHIPAARAMEVVAGFTIINDVSVRDWQWRTPTFTLGKSFDSHAPVRPVAGHHRRAGRARPARPAHLGQRRPAPGFHDGRSDLRLLRPDRVPDHRLPPRTRHHHRHGHAGRRGRRIRPASLPGRRRRRPHRDRGDRRARQPRRPGRGAGAGRPHAEGPGRLGVTTGAPARQNGGVPDTETELSDAERADRLSKLQGIIDLMRPAVQADGGDLVLVRADVDTGVVEVQLQGACSSCAVSSATLSGGVERILRERLSWVTEVVGGLDDSLSMDESSSLGSGGYVPNF